jgi:hypothetical protein
MTMDDQTPVPDTREILERAWRLKRLTLPIADAWDRLGDIASEVRDVDAFRAAWVREQRSQRGEWQ